MIKIKSLALAISIATATCFVPVMESNAANYELKKPVYVYVDGKLVDSALFTKSKDLAYMFEASVELSKGEHKIAFGDKTRSCDASYVINSADGKLKFGTTTPLSNCAGNKTFNMKILLPGTYKFSLSIFNEKQPSIKVLRATTEGVKVKRQVPVANCIQYKGGTVTVDVKGQWPNGTLLRDAYTGNTVKVTGGKVKVTPSPASEGLVLLEKADTVQKPKPFTWDNAVVYFLLTDRFYNGNKNNDHSFGRMNDGKDEIGTFHGGDFQGIIKKLDYLKELGINAIWINPMVEQAHGYINGGDESHSFPFYAYHGYWAADFTRIDPNYGTDEDLRQLVKECHKRGIRLLVDTVMNHPGYATLADLQDFGITSVTKNTGELPARWADYKPKGFANWQAYSQFIDYNSNGWLDWWGNKWVRAGFPHHQEPGVDDQNMGVAGLPDFMTESTAKVSLPKFLKNKKDTRAVELKDATVLDYLVSWHTYWVRNFGIDGFRCDTVKHIQAEGWKKLNESASKAFKEWKKEHPSEVIDNNDFFMVGEVWDHGLSKDDLYYNNGFDSLINFDYQRRAFDLAQCMADAEVTYNNYAKLINDPKNSNFNALSYISSHDTKTFWSDFQDFSLQKRAANALLMLPGQVQIYYGDESGREIMPDGGVSDQAWRSDMNWGDLSKPEYKDLYQHWSKLNKFRLVHPAVAAGTHTMISNKKSPYYAFVRQKGDDKVMVVFVGNAKK